VKADQDDIRNLQAVLELRIRDRSDAEQQVAVCQRAVQVAVEVLARTSRDREMAIERHAEVVEKIRRASVRPQYATMALEWNEFLNRRRAEMERSTEVWRQARDRHSEAQSELARRQRALANILTSIEIIERRIERIEKKRARQREQAESDEAHDRIAYLNARERTGSKVR
jgi:hypothetical protein